MLQYLVRGLERAPFSHIYKLLNGDPWNKNNIDFIITKHIKRFREILIVSPKTLLSLYKTNFVYGRTVKSMFVTDLIPPIFKTGRLHLKTAKTK
jgi:hypothetical protein